MAQVSPQAVLTETQKAIQQRAGSDDYVQSDYGFTSIVASALGVEFDSRRYGGGTDWTRLEGQVKRALEKLARMGFVVKVAPSERGPDGVKPRWTRYYLPAKHAELAAAHTARQQRHAAARARWDDIVAGLTRVLGPFSTDHLGRPMLSQEQWGEILESLVTSPGQEG